MLVTLASGYTSENDIGPHKTYRQCISGVRAAPSTINKRERVLELFWNGVSRMLAYVPNSEKQLSKNSRMVQLGKTV